MAIVTKERFNELVFEDRNKSFGAYFIRKRYSAYVLVAFGCSLIVFTLALASPIIYNRFLKQEEQFEEQEMVVAEVMKVEDIQTKPEEVKKLETPVESIKYPPLEIKPDEEVVKEEEVASAEELEKSNPGAETTEGEKGIKGSEQAAQAEPEKPKEPIAIPDEAVATWVDQEAQFPGGDGELINFIKGRLHYTPEAKASNIQGMVVIEFIVGKDGSLTDFKVLKSLGYGLDEAAMSIIKSMPNWKPGSLNGEVKKVRKRVKIPFSLR